MAAEFTDDAGVTLQQMIDAIAVETARAQAAEFSTIQKLWNGGNTYREPFPRIDTTLAAASISASGVMYHIGVPCLAGDVITNITVRTGNVAAIAPTNWWFALYDTSATPAFMSQTADQLTTPMSAQQPFTLALQAPQVIPVTGVYYAAIMVKAGTVPNFNGHTSPSTSAVNSGYLSGQKRIAGFSGTGLTTTAPGTIASPTVLNSFVYVVLS